MIIQKLITVLLTDQRLEKAQKAAEKVVDVGTKLVKKLFIEK